MDTKIVEIDVSKIKFNPNQPRKEFDKEKLKELSNSIKTMGLINPIQVKKVKNTDFYELICGERRVKAHKLADIKTIKAIVKDYNSKSDEMVESLIENLHREDLSSVEKENFITALWETGKYKEYKKLAKVMGLSGDTIARNLDAKKVREETKATRVISTRVIDDVSSIKNIEDKKRIFKKIEAEEISSNKVREVARVISKSPRDIKQAFFSNMISIEQANKISKITSEKIRKQMILAHKNIRNIDRSIERNMEKIMPKTEKKLVRVKEIIENFRSNAFENQKVIQRTIKSLMACLPYINLMDDNQLKTLRHFQELLEMNLTNALELFEKLNEKIIS